jgi:hypothetical protein
MQQKLKMIGKLRLLRKSYRLREQVKKKFKKEKKKKRKKKMKKQKKQKQFQNVKDSKY